MGGLDPTPDGVLQRIRWQAGGVRRQLCAIRLEQRRAVHRVGNAAPARLGLRPREAGDRGLARRRGPFLGRRARVLSVRPVRGAPPPRSFRGAEPARGRRGEDDQRGAGARLRSRRRLRQRAGGAARKPCAGRRQRRHRSGHPGRRGGPTGRARRGRRGAAPGRSTAGRGPERASWPTRPVCTRRSATSLAGS